MNRKNGGITHLLTFYKLPGTTKSCYSFDEMLLDNSSTLPKVHSGKRKSSPWQPTVPSFFWGGGEGGGGL